MNRMTGTGLDRRTAGNPGGAGTPETSSRKSAPLLTQMLRYGPHLFPWIEIKQGGFKCKED